MCYFVLAILPDHVNVEALQEIAERYYRCLKPLINPALTRHLRTSERVFTTTPPQTFCDCSTPIGYVPDLEWEEQERLRYQKKLAQLRKRGWSDAKIERWIEQRAHNGDKRERAVANKRISDHSDSTPTLDDWLNFISESVETGGTSSFGLLKHSFRGSLEEERIKVLGNAIVHLSQLNQSHLADLAEDTILRIIAK